MIWFVKMITLFIRNVTTEEEQALFHSFGFYSHWLAVNKRLEEMEYLPINISYGYARYHIEDEDYMALLLAYPDLSDHVADTDPSDEKI